MNLDINSTDSKYIIVSISFNSTNVKSVSRHKLGSQILLELITNILKRNKKKLSNIKSIGVNTGPGSFTGTRIGVAVANALGYALNVPVNGKKGKIAQPKYLKSRFDL